MNHLKLLCYLGIHSYDKTSDPRCFRCNKFKHEEDPQKECEHLFTREARNYAARLIQKRRELGIQDPY